MALYGRLSLLVVGTCVLLVVFAGGARARLSADPTVIAPQGPTEGIFDGPCPTSPSEAVCEARIGVIASAGFQVLVESPPPYSAYQAGYLQALSRNHVQAMWELDRWPADPGATNLLAPYSDWKSACGCQNNGQLLSFMTQKLTENNVTYGWYVGDDSQLSSNPTTMAQQIQEIKQLSVELKADAPGTITLMSTWGLAWTDQLTAAYGTADLTSQEAYPLFSEAESDGNTLYETGLVNQSAQLEQQISDQRGGDSSMILQSFSWGACTGDRQAAGVGPDARYPDATELLDFRNAAVLNSRPVLLLWWNLEQTIGWPGATPASCLPPTNTAGRLADLTAAIKAPIPAPPTSLTPPSISAPADNQLLSVSAGGTWQAYPDPTFAYQWLRCDTGGRNCQTIPGATSASYQPHAADVGNTLAATITATNTWGAQTAQSAPSAPVPGSAPANTKPPSIDSDPVEGHAALASPGAWDASPAPTFAYQWLRCDPAAQHCSAITGATSSSYTPGTADVGGKLTMTVKATNAYGTQIVQSAPSTPVQGVAPTVSAPPQIGSRPKVGQEATSSAGVWAGDPTPDLAYQWQRCQPDGKSCLNIDRAGLPSYTPEPQDRGDRLMVLVTASNPYGKQVAVSAASAAVGMTPENSSAPKISGRAEPKVGGSLRVGGGRWQAYPPPSFSYQWLRCRTVCTRIGRAHARAYTPRQADLGQRIKVKVTARNVWGSTSVTSALTARVAGGSPASGRRLQPTTGPSIGVGQPALLSALGLF